MDVYFPSQGNAAATENFVKLKERTSYVLQKITGAETQKQIDDIDAYFLQATAPQRFDGKEGIEARTVTRFEDLCIMLNQHVPKDPRRMTVLEFFRTLEVVKKQVKRQRG